MRVKYKERMVKLLENHDEIRIVFERETKKLEEEIAESEQNKCFNSLLFGMILTAGVFSVIMFFMMKDYGKFYDQALKGFGI